jgi:hypothetical protein
LLSFQYNVESAYNVSICFGTKENHEKQLIDWPLSGPSRCTLTSRQQFGIKYTKPNISSYMAAALFAKRLHVCFADIHVVSLESVTEMRCAFER